MTQLDLHSHPPTRRGGMVGALHAMRRALWPPRFWAIPCDKRAPRELERLFAVAIDALPLHVFLKDNEGRYLAVNATLASYFGRTPPDFIGRRAEELPFLPAPRVPIFSQSDLEVFDSGRPFTIPRVATQDPGRGEVIWRHGKFPLRDRSGAIVGIVGFSEDITVAVRQEEAVRSSRRLLQTVVDTLPQAMLVKDRHDRFIMANKALAEFYGLTPQQVVGLTTRELPTITAEEADLMQKSDAQAIRTRQPVDLPDVPMTGAGGRTAPRHVVKYPLKDEQGEVIGVIGMCEDISEREQVRRALEAEQNFSAAVFDNTPALVIVHDRNGRIVRLNKAAATAVGYAQEELAGRYTWEALMGTAEDQQDTRKRYATLATLTCKEALDRFGTSSVRTWRTKEGQLRQIAWNLAYLPDEQGKVAYQVASGVDNTERNRNEAELSRMAAAVEHAGDAVFITDAAGVIQYVNPAFETLTGYLRSEATGQSPRILKSGRHGADFYDDLWKTLRAGRVWKGRYTNRRKDGSYYETESTNSPIRDARGEVTGFVGVQKDVTERVQLEEQLRRSQRMEALGTLASGIAHDFNNILTPVLGYVEMLRAELPPDSRQAQHLRPIREAGQRGQDLVSKILQFGRQGETPRQRIDLKHVTEEVLALLRPTIPKNVAMHSAIAEGLSPVIADATQMHQVLMNLCVNAVQAMPQGGTLTVALDTVQLSDYTCYLGKRISGPFVRLTVTDTGIGIPEEAMSHIFEPFYTTKEAGKGTGLGLSTVFGIVQQHGGVIDLRSVVGEGSTFSVYLPVAAPKDLAADGADGRRSP